MRTNPALLVLLLVLLLAAPSAPIVARAADPEKLDESLEQELLMDLKNETPGPAGAKEPASQAGGKARPAGEDIGDSDDPIARIGQHMREVETRLAGATSPEETKSLQDQIVADLAKLIEQTCRKKQCSSSSCSKPGGSSGSQRSKIDQPPANKPSKGAETAAKTPARDSTDKVRADETAKIEKREVRDLLKDVWGNLPERTREELLQSATDKFLPQYEVEIEEYFRRLAEEPQGDAP